MILRWQEVAVPLSVVFGLLVLKHVPATAALPLAKTAGIIAFSYAIFLALRLVQGAEAIERDGWQELHASPVELFGALGASALSAMLLGSVLVHGQNGDAAFRHLAISMALALFFALLAGAIIFLTVLAKVRWNRSVIEHVDGLGKRTTLIWADVAGVRSDWRGITIWTSKRQRIHFSPYQSGAAQLTRLVAERSVRNGSTAAKAFAS